jgi:hypothetical protein
MNIEGVSEEGDVKLTASRDMHLKTMDGPRSSEVSEATSCSKPPFEGEPLGVITDWAEDAGGQTSSIYAEAAQNIETSSKSGFTKVTAKGLIDIRSLDSALKVTAKSDVDIKSEQGSAKLSASGDVDILAEGDLKLTAEGDVGIKGIGVGILAKLNVDVIATAEVNISSIAAINLETLIMTTAIATTTGLIAAGIPVESLFDYAGSPSTPGTADSATSASTAKLASAVRAIDVKSLMIVPEHESWTRDPDEESCPTPRNKKYQG